MLINPESHDFALRWHRDDIRENASEEEEREALGIWHYGVSRLINAMKTSSDILRHTLTLYRYNGIRQFAPLRYKRVYH